MKFSSAVLGIALLFSGFTANAAPYYMPDRSGPHLTFGAGITLGGDTLASYRTISGSTEDIKAGQLTHIYGGIMYHFYGSPIAARIAFGYQIDQFITRYGSATFDRTTLEAVPFLYLEPYSRMGLGVIRHMSPRFDDPVISGVSVDFKDATGIVFEYGYNILSGLWLDFRAVSIKYEAEHPEYYINPPASTDGSHVGFYISAEL